MIRRILVGGTIAAVLGVSLAACGSPSASDCTASAPSPATTAHAAGYTFHAPIRPAPMRPAPVRPSIPNAPSVPKPAPKVPKPAAPKPATPKRVTPSQPQPYPAPHTTHQSPASPFFWGFLGGSLGSHSSDSDTCQKDYR